MKHKRKAPCNKNIERNLWSQLEIGVMRTKKHASYDEFCISTSNKNTQSKFFFV